MTDKGALSLTVTMVAGGIAGASGRLDYQNNSPFINMEYSSGRIETRQERDDPYSTESQ